MAGFEKPRLEIGEILFDEYHHGYEPHPLAGMARDPRFRTAFWQIAGLFLLYVAARTWRMGPARPYRRDERRPAADYVRALGNLFRKGRKVQDVARSLRRSFLARLEELPRQLNPSSKIILASASETVRTAGWSP